ncbi:MAG TPA: phosphoglycerate kinase [Gemmatimonadaceae bacterium]|nr:phosphoglycerate kinase [Gemmatimonadaceae bacterium]
MRKKTLRELTDADVRNRRALVRVDFNVPMDEERRITDDMRIRAAIPTIRWLLDRGARVVLLSHLGRPKGRPMPSLSLQPVATRLSELLGRPVRFVDSTDTDDAIAATNALEPGEVLLLENTRFLPGEERNDPQLASRLAQLGDLYVNDAFGAAHRAHASTEGVAHHLHPAVAGLLMAQELAYLHDALAEPRHPFVAVLGGAKISGKIDVIEHLLPVVDHLLVGGAMACTFLRAMGLETGGSLVEPDRIDMAKSLLQRADTKLVLPEDAMVAPSLDHAARAHAVPRDAIPADDAMFDIGPRSAECFADLIGGARTVVWNGPMGVFETPPFDRGTKAVAEAMADATAAGATTIVGGGDSAAAVAALGLTARMSHVSTGGGASLELLEGKVLPGVAALDDAG